jgi:hypothetical protein
VPDGGDQDAGSLEAAVRLEAFESAGDLSPGPLRAVSSSLDSIWFPASAAAFHWSRVAALKAPGSKAVVVISCKVS